MGISISQKEQGRNALLCLFSVLGKYFIFGNAHKWLNLSIPKIWRYVAMRKKNFKGRCEKRKLPKCEEVCRTYDAIQYTYAEVLSGARDIKSFRANVLLDGLEEGDYTSDFVCVKMNGDLMVRECVSRQYLTKPLTAKLLDVSRNYWLRHGVTDWGIVIEREA